MPLPLHLEQRENSANPFRWLSLSKRLFFSSLRTNTGAERWQKPQLSNHAGWFSRSFLSRSFQDNFSAIILSFRQRILAPCPSNTSLPLPRGSSPIPYLRYSKVPRHRIPQAEHPAALCAAHCRCWRWPFITYLLNIRWYPGEEI